MPTKLNKAPKILKQAFVAKQNFNKSKKLKFRVLQILPPLR
jgi:hypothetical protein